MRRPFSYATSRIHLALFCLPSSMINVTVFPHFPHPLAPLAHRSVVNHQRENCDRRSQERNVFESHKVAVFCVCTCLVLARIHSRYADRVEWSRGMQHTCAHTARGARVPHLTHRSPFSQLFSFNAILRRARDTSSDRVRNLKSFDLNIWSASRDQTIAVFPWEPSKIAPFTSLAP